MMLCLLLKMGFDLEGRAVFILSRLEIDIDVDIGVWFDLV